MTLYSPKEHRQIVRRLQIIGHLDPDADYPYPGKKETPEEVLPA